ncbi:MAG: tail fiber domain-containing protein [Chitinophagaceae bacterium]|nr:tail fiber domain-containing protein [Chitinophagaceae bacterium]
MKVGIGNFATSDDPTNKLEVVDGSGDPQLRLSYTHGTLSTIFETNVDGDLRIASSSGNHGINVNPTSANLEIKTITGGTTEQLRLISGSAYTSFTTGSNGTLGMVPSNTTLGKIGINTNSPSQTLDVNGTAAIQTVAKDNTQLKVLMWNSGSSGLLQYRDATTFISPCAGGNTVNYLPKFSTTVTDVCNSQLYDDGTNVGVATTSPNTSYRMDINATALSNGLHVAGKFNGVGVDLITASSSNISTHGVDVLNTVTNSGGSSANFGTHASVSGASWENIGTYGSGTGGTTAYGGYFDGISATTAAYGVIGVASGSATTNYGVYGQAGGGTTNWAVYANGNAGGTTIWNPSDAILKTGVQPLTDGLSMINLLHPKNYYFDTAQFHFMNLPGTLQYGLIAEDVHQTNPSLVKNFTIPAQYDADGNQIHEALDVSYMNYIGVIPILISALQQEDQKVNELQAQLDGCCGLGMRNSSNDGVENVNKQSVELKSNHQTYLGQSIPNPNRDQCTIPYYVEESVQHAAIIFIDETGREINRVEIIGRGSGQLTVQSSQLENGVYTYSLIADGNVIGTKKMIKQD